MKPVAFDYLQARDLHQAAEALARSAGAKIIAGAQSLGPLLNLRLARPELLVDISRVRELQRIEETDSRWRIGAGVTHAQLEDLGARLVGAEMVSEVAAQIAYRSVRNRGTIGGSLAHADPAADWPLALAALGAVLVLKGRGGSEQRVAADFLCWRHSLELLSTRAEASGTQWALGLTARSRALITDGPGDEVHYLESIERLGDSRISSELARSHLVYGEWLRRERRRQDAREQLASHTRCCRTWASRRSPTVPQPSCGPPANIPGAAPRRRPMRSPNTSCTWLVLVATGLTNREAGTSSSLSPRTIEAHMRSIFRKLGVTSRRQLRDLRLR